MHTYTTVLIVTRNHKVIWEEPYRRPSRREWTRLQRVLLAVQCPLQTSPTTQLRVCYIHTAVPHSSCMLHCTVWSPSQAPSIGGSPPPPRDWCSIMVWM